MIDRIRRRFQRHFLPVDLQSASEEFSIRLAENAHGQLRASGTHQSVNTYDLSLAYMDGDVVNNLALRIQRVLHRPVINLQIDFADRNSFPFREAVGDLPAYHALDDSVLVHIVTGIVNGFDGRTIANHRDLIRHIGNLVQLMCDDNHGHAVLLELKHQIQQSLGIFLVQ